MPKKKEKLISEMLVVQRNTGGLNYCGFTSDASWCLMGFGDEETLQLILFGKEFSVTC